MEGASSHRTQAAERPPLVIWGASGHALVVADAARLQREFSVVGFIDDQPDRKGTAFAGGEVLGGRDALHELYACGVRHVHIAVGHCATRVRLAHFAQSEGFLMAAVVHPNAVIAASTLVGAGTFVAAGVIVNAGARLGENVILNTSCSVDHECDVRDGVHLGPGVRLGGGVQIGRTAWVGIGATILDHLSVGEGSIVGAGAVVARNVPARVVAYGVPAKVVRAVRPDE